MSHFQRLGSYYTPVNSDCVEFCPHPQLQQYLFTGHYELLSKDQGKLGQICLSEVCFGLETDSSSNHFTPIPSAEYCTATNKGQDVYMTRTVDLEALLQKPLASFGNDLDEDGKLLHSRGQADSELPAQPWFPSNISLKVHDQINIPALLDAKWANQRVPFYQVEDAAAKVQQHPSGFSSLIAAALEDGTVRLYSIDASQSELAATTQTTQQNCPTTDQAHLKTENSLAKTENSSAHFSAHSAVQISNSAICLYIDWSDRNHYTHRINPYLNGLKGDWKTTSHQNENNQNDQNDQNDPNDHNSQTDSKTFPSHLDYIAFWEACDRSTFGAGPGVTVTTSAQSKLLNDNLVISPHFCSPSTSPSLPRSHLDQDPIHEYADDDEYYDAEMGDTFKKGKTILDKFVSCSLSDGTVAILDVFPLSSRPDNGVEATDDVKPKFGLEMTHHWQAHNAECWVAAIDPFQPNTIYTGADDCLMKMWDLRIIPTVNQQMQSLDLFDSHAANDFEQNGPLGGLFGKKPKSAQQDPTKLSPKWSSLARKYEDDQLLCHKSQGRIMCPDCHCPELGLVQRQGNRFHGRCFDISHCTLSRGLQTKCSAPHCFCRSNLSSLSTTSTVPQQPTTGQYKYDLDRLEKAGLFHSEFTPVDAYPLITNTCHEAGVIEIKPHPYNPHLLMTGSYDNHISLYDKRNLKKPISRIDTGGGAWRIKWHSNPTLSNQFLLVNMYNGAQIGSIEGMNIKLERQSDQSDAFFQSLNCSKAKSAYPSPFSSSTQLLEGAHSYTSLYQAHLDHPGSQLNQTLKTPLTTSIDALTDLGASSDQLEGLSIELGEKTEKYDQHGPLSIVYGGDLCQLNDISSRTSPERSNVVVTCSFYNKRTDLLSIGQKE